MRPSALSRPTPPAYNNRGLARAAKGDLRGALSDYDEAIRLQPNLAEAYYSRAAFLGEHAEYGAVIGDYRKYLDLGGGLCNGDHARVEAGSAGRSRR